MYYYRDPGFVRQKREEDAIFRLLPPCLLTNPAQLLDNLNVKSTYSKDIVPKCKCGTMKKGKYSCDTAPLRERKHTSGRQEHPEMIKNAGGMGVDGDVHILSIMEVVGGQLGQTLLSSYSISVGRCPAPHHQYNLFHTFTLPPIFPFFSYTALSILSERLSNFLHNFAI
jgi:hypothetical protein